MMECEVARERFQQTLLLLGRRVCSGKQSENSQRDHLQLLSLDVADLGEPSTALTSFCEQVKQVVDAFILTERPQYLYLEILQLVVTQTNIYTSHILYIFKAKDS